MFDLWQVDQDVGSFWSHNAQYIRPIELLISLWFFSLSFLFLVYFPVIWLVRPFYTLDSPIGHLQVLLT